jgi:putative spermidine/putrescine transport system substrate-binding protein
MAWIFNNEHVSFPPQTRLELFEFVKTNPGVFTFDTHFTGMTFLKALMLDIAGDPSQLYGAFDEQKFNRYSKRLWSYLDSIRPYLWKEGETFPHSVAPMHQMFANGELWFSLSNNDAEVDNKIHRGIFDSSARAYVPEIGSIQNSHYLGIPANSGKKAAAMAAINFMISPAAQFKKASPKVWGDGTVLDLHTVGEKWKEKFQDIPGRMYAPPRSEIQDRAYMELAPEYMIRLYDDFQKYIAGHLDY